MLETLFKDFSKVLFEPIYIMMVLGTIILTNRILKRRATKNQILFSLFFFLYIFLRCFVMHTWSSRYSSLSICFAIPLAVYACDHITGFFVFKYNNRLLHRLFSTMLWLILLFSCITKLLFFNRYDDYMIKVGNYISSYSTRNNFSNLRIWAGVDTKRLSYYSGIRELICSDLVFEDCKKYGLKRLLKLYKSSGFRVCYCFSAPIDSNIISSKDILADQNQLSFISKYRKNNKGKSFFYVYYLDGTYTVKTLDSNQVKDYFLRFSKHLIKNGDFELAFNPNEAKELKVQTTNQKVNISVSDFENIPFPHNWSVNNGTPFFDQEANVFMDELNSIEGNYSLSLESNKLITIFNATYYPSYNYKLRFLSKGMPGSKFDIKLHLYDQNKSWIGCESFSAHISDGQLNMYEIDLEFSDFDQVSFFRICPALYQGYILLDGFTLEEIQYP